MTNRIPACVLPAFLGILLSSSALAHVPRHLAGTQCRVLFFEDRVEISIDLGFRGSWAQAEMLAADSDRNSVVKKSEADAFLQGWRKRVLRRGSKDERGAITCSVDGVQLELELVKSLHEGLVGQVAPTPFSLYYTVIARLQDKTLKIGTTRRVEIVNRILEGEVPGLPLFLVPFSGHGLDPSKATLRHRLTVPGPQEQIIDGQGQRILIEDRKLAADLSLHPAEAGVKTSPRPLDAQLNPPGKRTAARSPATKPRTRQEKETAFFNTLLGQDLSAKAFLGFLFIVFSLGAGHALAPGHGKTVVAAYLLGSRCRYRDAVLLGLTTTFAHTLTVIITATILLAIIGNLTLGVLQERIITACMLLSGILLTAMGLVIFLKRARHDAMEKPQESSDDDADPDPHRRSLTQLLGLGISSGLLPCTSGIMVTLSGLHQPGKLFFSLALLLSFSMGLGFVLVLIGLLTVSSKKLVATHRVFEPLRRKLPGFSRPPSLVSALLILASGAFLLSRTVLSRPTEIAEIFAWTGF